MFTGDHGPGVYADRDEPHTRDYRSARSRSARSRSARSPSASAARWGSGKTVLLLALCRRVRDRYSLGIVTNDILTEGGRRVRRASRGP